MVTPADLFKQYNEIKKQVRNLNNKAELSVINRDKIWKSIDDLRRKSSRIEKLVLLLAVIQTIYIFIGV
jgi:hypothetical protein|tara:strand:- start:989 stop:1195 length:207 start_codon:yes stop_codon:yes gene_type:complete